MDAAADTVELLGDCTLPAADREWLHAMAQRAAAVLPVPVARAAVRFVDDAQMSAMHARFMNDPTTTDVLTFALNAPGQPVDADIAVCVPEAARRAVAQPFGLRAELLLYILHGMLHACGHDDRDPASHGAMHAEEDRILQSLGVGRVFGAGEAAP